LGVVILLLIYGWGFWLRMVWFSVDCGYGIGCGLVYVGSVCCRGLCFRVIFCCFGGVICFGSFRWWLGL